MHVRYLECDLLKMIRRVCTWRHSGRKATFFWCSGLQVPERRCLASFALSFLRQFELDSLHTRN